MSRGAWLVLLVASLLLMGASGHLYSADGLALWQVAHNLLAGHGPVIAPKLAAFGHWHDGKLYAKFGLGHSLLLLPFVVAGSVTGALAGNPAAEGMAVAFANTAVVTLLAGFFWQLLGTFGIADGVRRDLTLLLVFTTPLWVYAKQDFPEPLCALLLTLTLLLIRRGRHLAAGLAAGALLLVRFDCAVPVAAFLVVYPVRDRHAAARFVTGIMPGAVLLLLYNFARYGSFFTTGFGDPDETFSTPLLLGLGGLLFSPGKSLLLYAPVLLLLPAAWLAMRRHEERLAWLLLLMSVAYTVLHAKWYAWMGGWCWGPRRLVPLLPVFMLAMAWWPAATWLRRRLLFVLALCGLLVNLAGVAVNYNDYLLTEYHRVDTIFTAEHSPVLWHWRHILSHGHDFLPLAPPLLAGWVLFWSGTALLALQRLRFSS